MATGPTTHFPHFKIENHLCNSVVDQTFSKIGAIIDSNGHFSVVILLDKNVLAKVGESP